MRAGGRVYICKRAPFAILPAVPAALPPGWQYSVPDGEKSYGNCLLTTLAVGPRNSVEITTGKPVPLLAQLANDPRELDWIAHLPFRYESLDAAEVIDFVLLYAARKKPSEHLRSEWINSVKVLHHDRDFLQTFEFKLKRRLMSKTLLIQKL